MGAHGSPDPPGHSHRVSMDHTEAVPAALHDSRVLAVRSDKHGAYHFRLPAGACHGGCSLTAVCALFHRADPSVPVCLSDQGGAGGFLHHPGADLCAFREALRCDQLPDGRSAIIHRKGATPAHPGELGIIPGSMATPGYIVSGNGCPSSLFSASHGAGRTMSRLDARNSISRHALKKYLAERKVTLIGGTTEEAPQAYKDIHLVMESQQELVNIEGIIIPRIVRMSEE